MAGPSHQRPIELILLRELARRLSTPVTLYDANGRLAYLNPAAEALFAVDFEELGEISLAEAVAIIRRTDADSAPIPAEHMPIGIALGQHQARQANMWVHDQNGMSETAGSVKTVSA